MVRVASCPLIKTPHHLLAEKNGCSAFLVENDVQHTELQSRRQGRNPRGAPLPIAPTTRPHLLLEQRHVRAAGLRRAVSGGGGSSGGRRVPVAQGRAVAVGRGLQRPVAHAHGDRRAGAALVLRVQRPLGRAGSRRRRAADGAGRSSARRAGGGAACEHGWRRHGRLLLPRLSPPARGPATRREDQAAPARRRRSPPAAGETAGPVRPQASQEQHDQSVLETSPMTRPAPGVHCSPALTKEAPSRGRRQEKGEGDLARAGAAA